MPVLVLPWTRRAESNITGATQVANFPTTLGAFQSTDSSTSVSDSIFVSAFDPDGKVLIYSTYLGGRSGVEFAQNLAHPTRAAMLL